MNDYVITERETELKICKHLAVGHDELDNYKYIDYCYLMIAFLKDVKVDNDHSTGAIEYLE